MAKKRGEPSRIFYRFVKFIEDTRPQSKRRILANAPFWVIERYIKDGVSYVEIAKWLDYDPKTGKSYEHLWTRLPETDEDIMSSKVKFAIMLKEYEQYGEELGEMLKESVFGDNDGKDS